MEIFGTHRVALFCLTPQDSCASWGLYTIRTIPSEIEHTRVL